MKSTIFSTMMLIAGLLALPQLVQAADLAAGKTAYTVCAACHGQNAEGNRAMNAPKLAGQEAWYLERQLDDFRAGLRGTAPGDTFGMQMRPMAMAVGDPTAQANLIAYITSLPDVDAEPTISGDAAAGKASYTVCAACHGQNAEGNQQMGGPKLAGQEDWYLVRQITNYQKGLRGYDPKDTFGNQMKPMAATLTSEKAINDVVAYIDSLD
ncbi:MAG: c-type cytochrome [Pseudomonadales bacterium]|jgi:cytochrome c oxidase subunit 2